MSDSMTKTDRLLLDRREFTSAALMTLLSGVTVTIIGCGSDSPTSPTTNPNDRAGNVLANHGHTAVIASAVLTAGNAVTLDIRGTADHPHTVMLTMAEVGQIAAGQRVSKTSSTEGSLAFGTHSHSVVFN